MANRSAAHSWPLSGFIAIRCAPRSQQLSPSNQFGPSSGGAMTTGLRVWHGDRRDRLVHGRRDHWRMGSTARCRRVREVGRNRGWRAVGVAPVRRRARRSRLARPHFVVGVWVTDDACPFADLSPANVSRVWSPASNFTDEIVMSWVSRSSAQLVREMELAVGGRYRHRARRPRWPARVSRPHVRSGGAAAGSSTAIASSCCAHSVDGRIPVVSVTAPKPRRWCGWTASSAPTVRVRARLDRAIRGRFRIRVLSSAASGSTSFSVRNMKKNTTQPIAAMNSQLTSRR